MERHSYVDYQKFPIHYIIGILCVLAEEELHECIEAGFMFDVRICQPFLKNTFALFNFLKNWHFMTMVKCGPIANPVKNHSVNVSSKE